MRADRLVSLTLLLQTRPKMTAGELARELEVSERTIHRDLDALSGAGVPVYATRGAAGGVALMEGWRTQLTGFTRAELHALAAVAAPGALDDLGLTSALRSGLVKMAASLPALQQPALEYARQRLHVDASSWFPEREAVPHLATLRDAVWQDRRVSLTYRDFEGTPSRKVVAPYALVIKADRWYLVASTGEDEPRVYRGSRVEGARIRPETFIRPARFDLPAFWKAWCSRFAEKRAQYEVTLRLTAEAMEALRKIRPRAEGARLDAAPLAADGRKIVVVDFERESIAFGQLCDVGTGFEVLAPEALRTKLLKLATRILASHEGVAPRSESGRHTRAREQRPSDP
ncbi:helix-turn-helix transcriptional regulator [Myxococcus xanthus]|uniref:DNA-binding transcriptional regulator n=1 Tax=Myxococcus xanthus TaxID=34 RepID=A0AAE6FZ79_MYXXA|nr:WYL domain-containing protein [Myxococcus xanthus]QDE67694.1 DNA-binding transcriptional regulator [Myxococcus xanthus]QDE74971.1 DNA-binding transcriptional regulator [Myxococcus xanthus]QDE82242.1 DNA-binding transcriptional regulator [Myxococcus xanthus]QDE96543.1 DNA-binding transcriptional regulator [Myxococcus xanthus]QDF04033.1 DNA-binding transcriptional regulator [Myxococcus xanthus]